ncbi:hypothetical protein [Telluribacter sp.]|jgi:hypothetical protein|uniref:hypothetical protein n=1 Tax=Telluribacter sp. TaxID=1978767 RepID=UPI002E0F92B3|nr:hypothetical protein [Telluribacter sp.]
MKPGFYYLLPLLFLFLKPATSKGQLCQEVKLHDDQQRNLLMEYIQESYRERYFHGDKGVVHLTKSKDSMGKENWYLEAVIDDRYRDRPPTQWASFNGKVILIYNSDHHLPGPLTDSLKTELINCLQEVIQDRLYIRPPKQDRWYDVEEKPGVPIRHAKTGKPLRSKDVRIQGGNAKNDKIITFYPDGTYKVLIPV